MELAAVSALGLNQRLSQLAYSDESEVLFACGRCILQCDEDTMAQSVFLGAPDAAGITAFAVSSNRKYVCLQHT